MEITNLAIVDGPLSKSNKSIEMARLFGLLMAKSLRQRMMLQNYLE